MHSFKESPETTRHRGLPAIDFESCVLGVSLEESGKRKVKEAQATPQGAQMYSNAMVIGNEESPIAEISSLLEESGIETVTINNAAWRVEHLDEAHPQVIIVETGSDTKGWEISTQIRRHCDIPIIMLGTTDSEMAWVKAAAYGVDCYLERPFSPIELVARIKAIIRRYQSNQESSLQAPTSVP